MRVAVISGNLGSYDPQVEWVPQSVPANVSVAVHRLTDANFPPRPLAMTSRLQAGIPKMFGWQLFPGYDFYIWIDASRGLLRSDTVAWFLEQWGSYTGSLMVFNHPERSSVRAEYEFIKARLARPGEKYLTSRYGSEWLEEQYAVIAGDSLFHDQALYASTAFAYVPRLDLQATFTAWWVHKTRYLLHDQLALPYVIHQHLWQSPRVLEDNVYDCIHLPITRK